MSLAPFALCTVSTLLAASEARATDVPEAVQRLRHHYEVVEEELLARVPPGLSQAQLEARERVVELLREYKGLARNDVRTEFPGERRPHFRYPDGEHCAVAHILDRWGEGELLDRLVATRNHGFVAELDGDEEFQAWLGEVGITQHEAARIHSPIPPPPIEPPPVYEGPGDTGPRGGSSGPSVPFPGSPSAPAPTAPGVPSTGGPDLTAPAPMTGVGNEPSSADWRTWWELNKLEWFAPNRIDGDVVHEEGRTYPEDGRQRLLRELEPLLERHLVHGQADVRAAAATALARSGGPSRIGKLMPLLSDASLDVRTSAILAFGAAGSERGVHPLLWIAREGAFEGRDRIAPHSRELAVLALGLAGSRSAGRGAERMLPSERNGGNGSGAGEDLGFALLLRQGLAPSAAQEGAVRETSGFFRKRPRHERLGYRETRERARAVEALRVDADRGAAFSALLQAIGTREVEVRRSAAATLGVLGDRRALAPLQTAFELEGDALARGLLLVSIGRLGGEEARDFLARELRRGKQAMRPWTALALGILARGDGDEEARRLLRERVAKERNVDTRGALLLASGIALDESAVSALRYELLTSRNPHVRACAGYALAMTRHEAAREALRRAVEPETEPSALAALAQSLAHLGDGRDVELLLGLLERTADPELQVHVSSALGAHGTPRAAFALARTLERDDLSPVARAGALRALGLLLSRDVPFQIARLALGSNPSILPDWLRAPILSTI